MIPPSARSISNAPTEISDGIESQVEVCATPNDLSAIVGLVGRSVESFGEHRRGVKVEMVERSAKVARQKEEIIAPFRHYRIEKREIRKKDEAESNKSADPREVKEETGKKICIQTHVSPKRPYRVLLPHEHTAQISTTIRSAIILFHRQDLANQMFQNQMR